MSKRRWLRLGLALLLVGAGAFGGWAARRPPPPAAGGPLVATVEELDELRRELRLLRAETAVAARVRGPGAAMAPAAPSGEAPAAAASAPPEPPPSSPEADNRYFAEYFGQLETARAAAPWDGDFSQGLQRKLGELVKTPKLEASRASVSDVSCTRTLCRVTFASATGSALSPRAAADLLVDAGPELSGMTIHTPPGGSATVAYVARDGFELPPPQDL